MCYNASGKQVGDRMTELLLVRHGETDWNKQGIIQGRHDIPLNETGKKQAEYTMKQLQGIAFDHIFSSPLIRAKETAQIIADGLGVKDEIKTITDLQERDFGEADGKPVSEYYPQVLQGDITDMESDEELETRVFRALRTLAQENPNKRLLVVCHSHVIKAALHAINPEEYDYKTRLLNGSVTTLSFDYDAFTIKSVKNFNSF